MSAPEVVSQAEWLAARKELLAREKELTRARDALNAERRRLPMVEVQKPYEFQGPDGRMSLVDLFDGRRQLVVYHMMWLPDVERGCPSCSAFVDQIGHLAHLNARDTTFAVVSRAPFNQMMAFKRRMGWTFPWYSSLGSDFNFDFHASFDESVAPLEYNYGPLDADGWEQPFDLHGLSVFLREGDRVWHTYSAYARGVDNLGFTSSFLDLTPLGRQDDSGAPMYHDEY